MTDAKPESQEFQWKWVVLTLVLYVLLYFVPLLLAFSLGGQVGDTIFKSWTFVGVVVISAVAGYFSRGVTIWEPAVASALLLILWYAGFQLYEATQGHVPFKGLVPFFVYLGAIFGLSLLGAGIGEGVQNLLKSRASDEEPEDKP